MPQDWNDEDDNRKPEPLKILGIEIGTSTGWHDGDPGTFGITGYEPNEAFKGLIEPGELWFDFNEGLLKYYDDEGNVTKEVNLLALFTTAMQTMDVGSNGKE